MLTRRPERLSLPRRPELLLQGLLEARLRQPRRAPHLQLYILLVINPVRVQDRREVDVGEVAAVEGAQAVLSEMFDPLRARPIVHLWVLVGLGRGAMGVTVRVGHAWAGTLSREMAVGVGNRCERGAADAKADSDRRTFPATIHRRCGESGPAFRAYPRSAHRVPASAENDAHDGWSKSVIAVVTRNNKRIGL